MDKQILLNRIRNRADDVQKKIQPSLIQRNKGQVVGGAIYHNPKFSMELVAPPRLMGSGKDEDNQMLEIDMLSSKASENPKDFHIFGGSEASKRFRGYLAKHSAGKPVPKFNKKRPLKVSKNVVKQFLKKDDRKKFKKMKLEKGLYENILREEEKKQEEEKPAPKKKIKDMTPEEKREYNRLAKQKQYQRDKEVKGQKKPVEKQPKVITITNSNNKEIQNILSVIKKEIDKIIEIDKRFYQIINSVGSGEQFDKPMKERFKIKKQYDEKLKKQYDESILAIKKLDKLIDKTEYSKLLDTFKKNKTPLNPKDYANQGHLPSHYGDTEKILNKLKDKYTIKIDINKELSEKENKLKELKELKKYVDGIGEEEYIPGHKFEPYYRKRGHYDSNIKLDIMRLEGEISDLKNNRRLEPKQQRGNGKLEITHYEGSGKAKALGMAYSKKMMELDPDFRELVGSGLFDKFVEGLKEFSRGAVYPIKAIAKLGEVLPLPEPLNIVSKAGKLLKNIDDPVFAKDLGIGLKGKGTVLSKTLQVANPNVKGNGRGFRTMGGNRKKNKQQVITGEEPLEGGGFFSDLLSSKKDFQNLGRTGIKKVLKKGGAKRKLSKGASDWVSFVKQVARDKNISYKEAMSVASKLKRS